MHSKAVFIQEQYKGFCETPSFVLGSNFGLPPAFETPFVSSENFDEISEELQKHDYLGKRMEFFFQQWIKSSPRYDLLAHSIQLIKDKQTLGELDFLVEEIETKQIIHIELVYKCYLWDPKLSKNLQEALAGPNYKDFFHWKQEKLVHQQFPLLHQEITQKSLKNLFPWIDVDKIQQQTCFKAQVFVPENKIPDEAWFNSDCIVGNWYKLEEFKAKNWEGCQFHIPYKFLWPCLLNEVEWISFDELLPLVEERLNNRRAPMLWIKDNEGKLKKCFVVV